MRPVKNCAVLTSLFDRMPSGFHRVTADKPRALGLRELIAHVLGDDRLQVHNRVFKIPVGDEHASIKLVVPTSRDHRSSCRLCPR